MTSTLHLVFCLLSNIPIHCCLVIVPQVLLNCPSPVDLNLVLCNEKFSSSECLVVYAPHLPLPLPCFDGDMSFSCVGLLIHDECLINLFSCLFMLFSLHLVTFLVENLSYFDLTFVGPQLF